MITDKEIQILAEMHFHGEISDSEFERRMEQARTEETEAREKLIKELIGDNKAPKTMTEQEAIKVIKNNFPKTCKMVDGRYKGGFDDTECDFGKALLLSISALEEIHPYRALGTVKELNYKISHYTMYEKLVEKYRNIGAPEELQKAIEKQRAKKPKLSRLSTRRKKLYVCPNCSNQCLSRKANERQDNRYCWDCGQAIDWETTDD